MVSGISFSDAVQLLVTYQYKLGNATKHLQKSVDSVTHDLQDGFDDFLTKTFLPRIYGTAEIQELPKATPEVQASWISNLRKRLYLSEIEQGNVEKKQEPATDIEKSIQDFIKQQQPTSGNSEIEKRFNDMLKNKGNF